MSIYESLTDKEAFTIEATYARTPQDTLTAWLFCFGSNAAGAGANYLFYSPFFGDNIRSGIKDSTTEQLLNTNLALEADQYYTVDLVFDHGKLSLYVDGVLASSVLDSGLKMENIIKNGTSNDMLGFI